MYTIKTLYIPIQVNLFSLVYRYEINQINRRQGLGAGEVKGGSGLEGLAIPPPLFGGQRYVLKSGQNFVFQTITLNYMFKSIFLIKLLGCLSPHTCHVDWLGEDILFLGPRPIVCLCEPAVGGGLGEGGGG